VATPVLFRFQPEAKMAFKELKFKSAQSQILDHILREPIGARLDKTTLKRHLLQVNSTGGVA